MNSWTKGVRFVFIQEDDLLLQFYVEAESFKKWKQISDRFFVMGISKSVYECRERYISRLDPNIKNQKWTKEEIQSLFLFYRKHGSKWQKMQDLLPQRTQGQLKNKFYSFLRSFILKVMQQLKRVKIFKVNLISSKTIKKLFEGKEEFSEFGGRMAEYLESIEYEISSQRIQQLLNKRDYEIRQIIEIMFRNSQKVISKQISELDNYDSLKKECEGSWQKMQQNMGVSLEQSGLDNHSQKKSKLKETSQKQSFLDPIDKLKPSNQQLKSSQKVPISQPMMNHWDYGKEMLVQLSHVEQPQFMGSNSWLEWVKYQPQFQFYNVDNCMGFYQAEHEETRVSRQDNLFYYCMPFNGQQPFYYHF